MVCARLVRASEKIVSSRPAVAAAFSKSCRPTSSGGEGPTLSHHLKKLHDAGIVDSERQGLWAYYYVIPNALQELSA